MNSAEAHPTVFLFLYAFFSLRLLFSQGNS